jgi:DnaD/phage-associated family protein
MTSGVLKPRFAGFPAGAHRTSIPNVFFSELLAQIEDEAELRITLYVFYALGRRKGYPRFVTLNELRAEAPLLAALGNGGSTDATTNLERGLDAAIERGTLISLDIETSGTPSPSTGKGPGVGFAPDRLIFTNTASDRRAIEQLEDGRIQLGRALPSTRAVAASPKGNVYQLYEENIGPLTPIVAEELREAEALYPVEWIEEAFREAALQNKRSWRYAEAILRRWATEGRAREKAGRDPGEGNSARAQLLRRLRGDG